VDTPLAVRHARLTGVLVALIACKGAPARIAGGIADTARFRLLTAPTTNRLLNALTTYPRKTKNGHSDWNARSRKQLTLRFL